MTVSTTQTRFANLGDSSTTDFSFSCKFFVDANIVVKVVTTATGAILATPSYTIVSKVSDGNGGYSSATVRFAAAPATGTTVIRYLDIGLTQEVNFTSEGNVLTAANRFADRDELKLQRVDDRLDRALVLNDGEIFAIDPTMPNVTGGTAGQFLALGSGKTSLIWATGAAGGTISAAMLPVATAASLAAGQIAFGVREVLTANRSYYVNHSTGSNSNTGLSSGAAFATFAYALSIIRVLDFNAKVVTLEVAAGTITERLIIDGPFEGQREDDDFIILGDTTTPSNCTLSTSLSTINVYGGARCKIHGFKIVSSAIGAKIYEDARVVWGVMEWGACTTGHIQVAHGRVTCAGNYTISGNAPYHVVAEVGSGNYDFGSITVTLSGTPAFSTAFLISAECSYIAIHSATFSGSATGSRYQITDSGNIVPAYKRDGLPGNAAGTHDELQAQSGYLYGLGLSNNVADATNDIDFAVGTCLDSTNVALIKCATAMTKRLDAAWTAGTGGGGLDTGAIGDVTYFCYAIKKVSDGTGDFLFSASATAPTMPSGYTYFRRIGAIMRASAAIRAFTQNGDQFMLAVPVAEAASVDPGTSAVLRVMTVPLGVKVEVTAMLGLIDATPAAATYLLLTSPEQTDTAASSTLHTIAIAAAGAGVPQRANSQARILTDTAGRVRLRIDASTADTSVVSMTYGWVDTRGR